MIFSGSAGRWTDSTQCSDILVKERAMRDAGGRCQVCRRTVQSEDEDAQHYLSW